MGSMLMKVAKPSSCSLSSKASSKFQIVQTTVPSVYTTNDLDKELDFSKSGADAKMLFGATPYYIHPSEFNYKLPMDGKPEFAFVGRSNVGKSSLIDLLLGSHKLVKVSKEPGCTGSINYYGLSKEMNEKKYIAFMVDLPGYGFAKKSKAEQQKWGEIIVNFLKSRNQAVLR